MGGLKSIEMQVALPRTQTAGKLQDQLQQRGLVTQNQLSQKEVEEQNKKRTQVTESEASVKKRLNNDSEKDQNSKQQKEQKKTIKGVSTAECDEEHPFKGKHFDVKW